MENATIEVRNNKKGELCGVIIFEDNKKIALPPWVVKQINLTYNGKACQVQRIQGQPNKVVIDDKEYNKPAAQPAPRYDQGRATQQRQRPGGSGGSNRPSAAPQRGDSSQSRNSAPAQAATAPYNFVPINKEVVTLEEEFYPLNKYDISSSNQRLSGKIELKIETLTPLFIRGAAAENRLTNSAEPVDYDFFSPGGEPKIPGSSLRGMIRNLVEIVGCGKFENFDGARKLYYRSVYGHTAQTKKYRDKVVDLQNNRLHVKAGLLKKTQDRTDEFVIVPAPENGSAYYRVKFEGGNQIITGLGVSAKPPAVDNYKYKDVYFEAGAPGSIVKNIYDTKQGMKNKGDKSGYLVCSGLMSNKNKQWVVQEPDSQAKPLPVPDEVRESYDKDENRNAANLLEKASENNGKGIPCFYLANKEGEVLAFGHTAYFRLIYNKSIFDHLPEGLKNYSDGIDFAEGIFGIASKFASRVYFEDAHLSKESKEQPQLSENDYNFPKILSTPKPTTFQHYLMQGATEKHELVRKEELENWDSDKHIRGYKLYWHRDINSVSLNDKHSWVALPDEVGKHKTQYTARIKPLSKGVIFKGCVRFENLTKYELGALLFVIDLPANCNHKLGMAKPLGFGSIKIAPELFVVNRKKRYEQLFADGKWALAESHVDTELYKKAFAVYMLRKLNITNNNEEIEALWKEERMKELKNLLEWPAPGQAWLDKTMYMDLPMFANRPVLPEPGIVRG